MKIKKQKTKDFLKIALGIFIFGNFVFFINGGFSNDYLLDENIARYSGVIFSALIFSAIYVYFIRPVGRFFKKKFVAEDKDSISQKEVFKEMFLGDKNEKKGRN